MFSAMRPQVTRHIRPDGALVQQLREHLSDTELMELTFTIGKREPDKPL